MARGACCESALPLLKPGGALVLDNAERYLPHSQNRRLPAYLGADELDQPVWRKLEAEFSRWPSKWFTDGVSATAIFLKPKQSGS